MVPEIALTLMNEGFLPLQVKGKLDNGEEEGLW